MSRRVTIIYESLSPRSAFTVRHDAPKSNSRYTNGAVAWRRYSRNPSIAYRMRDADRRDSGGSPGRPGIPRLWPRNPCHSCSTPWWWDGLSHPPLPMTTRVLSESYVSRHFLRGKSSTLPLLKFRGSRKINASEVWVRCQSKSARSCFSHRPWDHLASPAMAGSRLSPPQPHRDTAHPAPNPRTSTVHHVTFNLDRAPGALGVQHAQQPTICRVVRRGLASARMNRTSGGYGPDT